MPETLKMGLKLLLITAVATFALALTHMITKEPIQIQAAKPMTWPEHPCWIMLMSLFQWSFQKRSIPIFWKPMREE